MTPLDIRILPALSDNYIFLVHDRASRTTAVVDPGEAEPVLAALAETGWPLSLILNTHHHGDHIGGNARLMAETGAVLVGPEADRYRIPDMGRGVADGDTVAIGDSVGQVIAVPGHTLGHIAFWFESAGVLFAGDTLFSLGCGRLLEGSGPQMWSSLLRLRALPADTLVYCGHEYTASNARFALAVDPENGSLAARAAQAQAQRAAGQPTIPSRLGEERDANPFLRVDDPTFRGRPAGEPAIAFTELRRQKDGFRG